MTDIPAPVPLERQVKAVERELALRRNVYGRRVAIGSMRKDEAAREIANMQAVLESLHEIASLRLGLKAAKADALEAFAAADALTERARAAEAEVVSLRLQTESRGDRDSITR